LASVTGGSQATIRAERDGEDSLMGTVGADVIDGGDFQDTIDGRGGNDVILGGHGDDQLRGGTGNDTIYDGEHQDRLFGNAGSDELNGDGGDDTLVGGTGNDDISGGQGQDLVLWRPGDGNDHIDGGQGDDRLRLELTNADIDRHFQVGYNPDGTVPSSTLRDFANSFENAPGNHVIPSVSGNEINVKGFSGTLMIGGEQIFITNMEKVELVRPTGPDHAMRVEESSNVPKAKM